MKYNHFMSIGFFRRDGIYVAWGCGGHAPFPPTVGTAFMPHGGVGGMPPSHQP